MLDLELSHMCLGIEVDTDTSEDQSLTELAGEILEESLLAEIKLERLEFPDSVLFLEAKPDGVLAGRRDEGGFEVPAITFLLAELNGDLPDKLLPEDLEVADFVLVDIDWPEVNLDNIVDLGSVPLEPPITDAFDTKLTLSEELKFTITQKGIPYAKMRLKKEVNHANASTNNHLCVLPCPFRL